MSVAPRNLLFIFSDEHNRDMLGCYGHPVVKTPNLDRLAARGVRFTDAYCNSPICVPSRASLATGRYVHEIRAWDNAAPYIGERPSWAHRLAAAGHQVTTIGKLHYRFPDDPTGFADQRLPMHVQDGEGDIDVWKSTMYEGAAAIPLIVAGPDVPENQVCHTPISLVDCFPTILEGVGVSLAPEDRDLPGTSLWPIARGESAPERTIFSEYHAIGSEHGFFMIRHRQYKYVYYVDARPQLFDLDRDPGENRDLALDPVYASVLDECEAALRRICNPEAVDRQAHQDQARLIDQHGGKAAVLARGYQIPYTPAPEMFR